MHVWSMAEVYIYYRVAQLKKLKEKRDRLYDMRLAMNGTVERCVSEIREMTKDIDKLITRKKKTKQKQISSKSLKLRLSNLGKKRGRPDS